MLPEDRQATVEEPERTKPPLNSDEAGHLARIAPPLFALYLLAGGLCGAMVAVPSVPIICAFDQWDRGDWQWQRRDVNEQMFPPIEPADALVGALILLCFGGMAGGVFLWFARIVWPMTHIPACRAVLCASLTGSAMLLVFACVALQEQPNPVELIRGLVAVAAFMALAALFGHLHGWLTGLAERWLSKSPGT